jgi:hypothetical protein
MIEFLSNLAPGMIVPVLGIAFTAITIIICGMTHRIAITWQNHKTREVSSSLIESMIDQGMSAEDIERVLNAAGLENSENPCRKPRNNQRTDHLAATKLNVNIG